jgi:hypothetical protein
MPWSWKTGPAYAAERDPGRPLRGEQPFPKDTLFCGAAGCTGDELCQARSAAGHACLVGAGAQGALLRQLGYVRARAGIV